MCGILGVTKNDEKGIFSGLSLLTHRGPDGQGIFCNEQVSLAQARLSIIDLSDNAKQPMFSKNGNLAIVFNGEIYNFLDLKKDLLKKGYLFKSTGDTEVILKGYEEYGVNFFQKMRGMWSVAIYDSSRGKIVLSRDQFGIKPLYYSIQHGVLCFASEVKALAPFIGKLTPNSEYYYQYFNLGYFIPPQTAFRGIKKICPGEILTWDLNKKECSFSRCLIFESNFKMNYLPDFQSSVDFLNEQLVESVEKHFISDVPVGLLLSGGNDSSLLAAISLFLGKRPIAYHLNINDGSDSYYAEKVIDHLKLDAIKIKMDDEMLVEQYEKIWNFLDEPTADSSVIPTSLIFSAIKGCSKVVLSGEGGDEMFGGYQRHAEIANKNKIKIQNKLLTFFNDIFYGYGGKKIRYINPVIHRAHNFYLKYFTDDSIGSYLACVKLAGFPYKQNNLRQDLYNLYSATDHALKLPAGLFYDRFMYLPNDLMYKGDISSMTSSIENRVPFLDKNLVSSIYNRIRPEYLLSKNFQNKLILKKVMEKYFPQELIYRKKKGFSFSFQRFDCPSFRNDIERALYFHKENLDIFGLRDSNFSRFIDIKNRDILFKKYPNLVFALVSNYRIFCRIL